jgi:membrane-associated phospholipid phosphatase
VNKLKKIIHVLTISDAYILGMLIIYTMLSLIFWGQLQTPILNFLSYIVIATGVIVFAIVSSKYKGGKVFTLVRRLYVIPIVFFIYSNIHLYIPLVNPHDYDTTLIAWDLAIFGVNPTEWIGKLANPLLTEYLQFAYMMFYVLPFILGVEFTLRESDDRFFEFARIVIFGFFFSYILYFFMPAIGPRFTIHDFSMINTELPGLFLTDFFRDLVNAGGGVMPDTVNPAEIVNRDCMPSGHTMMTLITILIAFKFKSKYKWIVAVIGFSLIFSTVYLRYHYVVDVVAGIAFALLTMWLEPKIELLLRNLGFYKYD